MSAGYPSAKAVTVNHSIFIYFTCAALFFFMVMNTNQKLTILCLLYNSTNGLLMHSSQTTSTEMLALNIGDHVVIDTL